MLFLIQVIIIKYVYDLIYEIFQNFKIFFYLQKLKHLIISELFEHYIGILFIVLRILV